MRRFEVYFLQKKVAGVWDTLERSQSVSLLVASLVREFDAREDAEVRILAGSFDEAAGEWEYSQIFFVDRGAIELALGERDDMAEPEVGRWEGGDAGESEDTAGESVPGGRAFADAIRRASDDSEPSVDELWRARRSRSYADEDGDEMVPVGPPPRIGSRRSRSGKAFFMIGTLLIATILTGAALVALGIAFDLPQVRPLLSMIQGSGSDESVVVPGRSDSAAVMPKTTGKVTTFPGVAAGLRGRWSPGRCDQTYIEFDADGLVVGTPGGQQSLKVPVIETLEDDYTWYIRRSADLVEHFQKLGPTDLQLVGDTTRVGFSARTSDILTRCP